MQLIHDKSALELDLAGGRIVSLILNSFAVLGTFARIDGKIGNSHLCIPNFGKEGVDHYGLPGHGPARDDDWEVANKTKTSLTIQYEMPPTGSYPTTLLVTQTFSLDNHQFAHTIYIENTGSSNAPVNLAVHYYWHMPSGWKKLALNGEKVSKFIQQDTSIACTQKTKMDFPGMPSVTMITSDNMKRLQLWTGRTVKNDSTVYDTDYACIEPALGTGDFFGSRKSMLAPGSTRSCRITIAV